VQLREAAKPLGGYTLVTLPRIVTPYRDSVDGNRARVTYQKLVTRSRYELVRCAVGIWPSHQRDDTVTAGAGVDVERHVAQVCTHPFPCAAPCLVKAGSMTAQ